ncbi:MAG: hypothetical protein KDE27_15530 [Planctomycetes bacterium]|nr:hypothetical protein [Planctomycetota bacterium]
MKPAERAVLVLIVVTVAVALRWGFTASAFQQNPLRADAGHYAQYAANLVEHGVFSFSPAVPPPPDSFRSPGYPVFLAGCRLLGGDRWLQLAWALQVALGGLTVLLGYRLARVFLPFAPALAAALLAALSPHLVVAPAFVLTECVTTFVLTLGLWLFARAECLGGRYRFALASLTFGAAALCNEALAFVPIVLAWPLLRHHGARCALAFLVVGLLPVLAWGIRNHTIDLAHHGSERVIASISHGSYPGMVYENPRLFGFPYREDPRQPEFGSSWQGLRTVLAERISADPMRYAVWYLLEKPVWLWGFELVQGSDVCVYEVGNSPYERQPVMRATHWLMHVLHWPVMLLAAGAAVTLAWNRRRRFGVVPQALGLLAVFGTLAYLPVIPDPRYLQPFRPALFVLTGASVWAIGSWALRNRTLRRALARSASRRQPDVAGAGGQLADQHGDVAEAQ